VVAMSGGFHTITLGCKLNQFDTAAIEAELAKRGIDAVDEPEDASVVIINTCTVTGKADAEARRLIRRVRRRNPECRLLVTGCYAELEPETIRAIRGVDRVFGNRDKPNVSAILDDLGIGGARRPATLSGGTLITGEGDRGCDAALDLPPAVHFGDRARAFLKVQEGCNLACAYCVIPRVRGESRSVPPERVETAMARLVDSGYGEVVLTGVNTGDYGKDLAPRTNLAKLLGRLLAVRGSNRIRLNSLEPLTVTEEIVELMAQEPRLASHLQVPLQSGSETLLRRMRRNYRLEQYATRLERLRSAIPDIGLGADVIVGFPGETDERFEETYRFIEGSPLNYLHVFAWSARPGTPAADLGDRVHGSTVRARSRRLRDLAARLGLRFRRRFVGRSLDAVVLDRRPADGRRRALTDNFIEVALDGDVAAGRGELVSVRVTNVTTDGTRGVAAGRPAWVAA
jgi:threonylcarbamoyladenosine tRNA methylthiotransferase MtaB